MRYCWRRLGEATPPVVYAINMLRAPLGGKRQEAHAAEEVTQKYVLLHTHKTSRRRCVQLEPGAVFARLGVVIVSKLSPGMTRKNWRHLHGREHSFSSNMRLRYTPRLRCVWRCWCTPRLRCVWRCCEKVKLKLVGHTPIGSEWKQFQHRFVVVFACRHEFWTLLL